MASIWNWLKAQKKLSQPVQHPRLILLESLEPRLLLSADVLGSQPLRPLEAPPQDQAVVADINRGSEGIQDDPLLAVTASADKSIPKMVGDAFLLPDQVMAELRGELLSPPPAGQRPYGATYADNSEFMIGDVWVTVVLLESNGTIDPQTENWTATEIQQVKSEVTEGLTWWENTFHSKAATTPRQDLDFKVDFTYADSPVATGYEPINWPQWGQGLWIDSFLNRVGYNTASDYRTDLIRWNDAQRLAHQTHWAYTVFVVDSSADADGMFSDGRYFAYGYLGGPFLVMTYDNDGWGIGNMGQVLAHETGHIFYALDEYPGAGSYTDRAGYYNTQNLNAFDGNPNPSGRVASIMAEADKQNVAYAGHTSSPTSLQMLGWRDTDTDGILDVNDVPLTLTGTGAFNATTNSYQFSGSSAVRTLTNLNPIGLNNDITTNTVDTLQYRVDGGSWVNGNRYGTYTPSVSQNIPIAGAGTHTVNLRTVFDETGVASPLWSDTFTGGQTQVSIAALDASAGEPSNNGTYRVTRTGSTSAALTVNFTVAGTATRGSDYQLRKGTTVLTGNSVVINAGQAYVDVTLAVIDDTIAEPTETAIVTLAAGTGYTVGSANRATVNIAENEVQASIAATDASAGEPTNNGTYRISRTGPTSTALTVNFTVAGTATRGSDYQLRKGTTVLTGNAVVINAGQSYVDVTLAIIDDTAREVTETAIVTLAAGTGYTVATAPANRATVNIMDNEPAMVSIAATDSSAGEPSNNGTYRITRTGSTSAALTVNFTVAGTGTRGSDYQLRKGTTVLTGNAVVINAGQSYVDVTLAVLDDTAREVTETAIVTLAAGTGYTVATAPANRATVNIMDNEPAMVSIAATDASAGEPTNNGTYRITRTGSTSTALTVNFAISGTATRGSDYQLRKGTTVLTGNTVVIGAGQSYVDVTLAVLDDTRVELTETAIVALAAGTGYTVAPAPANRATVNIADNEPRSPLADLVAV